jgi:dihydrolipoamide dehydrogenase
MMESFDLVILGAGPGGYVAALRAATLGMRVACIEKSNTLGGTCLNVGCIPSKSLLYSSELYYKLLHEAALHGIEAQKLDLNFQQMMTRKDQVVKSLVEGIDYLFSKRKVTRKFGEGIVHIDHVQIGQEKIGFKKLILATGSVPTPLPFMPFDEKVILSSTGALSLPSIPKKMLIIGGGVIGLELGSVYAKLGTEIEVIEMMDRLVPTFDEQISHALIPIFQKLRFKFHFKKKVTNYLKTDVGCQLTLDDQTTCQGDVVLVSIGRKPLLPPGLNFELTAMGQVKVNASFETNIPNIYAIGDLIEGPMLAHKASEEACVLVDALAGNPRQLNYLAIPSVMYTYPEVVAVGLTEKQARDRGYALNIGRAPLKANPRARCSVAIEGMVKILADKGSNQVLGLHILCAEASEMAALATLIIQKKMSVFDVAHLPFAHPTLSESLKEAALDCMGQSLHF